MQSNELLKINLDVNKDLTLQLIQDMADAPLTFPTPNGGNHPLWILGHMTYAYGALLWGLMRGEPNPLTDWKPMFGMGTEAVADAAAYPPFDQIMAKCHEMHRQAMALLDSLSEQDLDQSSKNVTEEFKPFFGTYRLCFLMVANHWLMHRGQVADARLALGRPRLGP